MGDLGLVRTLVDLRDRGMQKNRIAFGNRASAIERGVDTASPATAELVTRWMERFDMLESEAEADIRRAAKGVQIIEDLTELRGIGIMLAAKLVSMVDITRSPTVSALWRYAGYGVIGGKRENKVKGETMHYNVRLKTTVYLIGGSFLKAGKSPYRAIYDESRERYAARATPAGEVPWTDGHQHLAALRRMEKHFLAHLWEHWRTLEGLPVRPLYALEYMQHSKYARPVDFGWRDLAGFVPVPSEAAEISA